MLIGSVMSSDPVNSLVSKIVKMCYPIDTSTLQIGHVGLS